MRRILTLSALLAASATVPARAQQGTAYAPAPPTTVLAPAPPAAAYAARPVDNRAILPAFSRRGGIGTTPFLGNSRGLGGFSTNYDAPPRTTAAPASPARRRGLFRRYR